MAYFDTFPDDPLRIQGKKNWENCKKSHSVYKGCKKAGEAFNWEEKYAICGRCKKKMEE